MLLSSISLFFRDADGCTYNRHSNRPGRVVCFLRIFTAKFCIDMMAQHAHSYYLLPQKKKKAANTQPHMLPFSKAYIQSLLQNIRVLRRCQAIVRWRTCDSVLWISATGRNLIHTWVTCCEFKSLLNLQHRGAAEGKRGRHAFRPRCLFLMGEESHSRKAE